MGQKIAFVSDFDGTITDDDFFNYAAKSFLSESSLEPWRRFKRGEETHFNALNEMFSKIRVSEDELKTFMDKIPIDPGFGEACKICEEKKFPLYICSAGCDFYINYLIGGLIKKYDITLITNHGVFSPETGLVMYKPSEDSPYRDDKTGISKAAVVNKLLREGYEVVYAGDGIPDYEAAWSANVVFARGALLEKCREAGVSVHSFKNFADINAYLKEL